jgi:hypothetical protein
MSNRTAKFVSAILASFLAGTPITTVSFNAARAADDCLTSPKKDQAREGGHWYYRIDRATKRHCWYLGEEREKLSQTVRPSASQSAKRVSQDAEPAMQQSIADARAELPRQTRIEQPSRVDALVPTMTANAATAENGEAVSSSETGGSIVASRWPDPFSANPPAESSSNKPDAGPNVDSTQPTESSVVTAGQLATADISSETSTYFEHTKLATLMGALALAGIIGSVVFKFAGPLRLAQAKVRASRGTIWESTVDDNVELTADRAADALPRRRGFARDLDRTGDGNDRIAEFFSQLSRRTPS